MKRSVSFIGLVFLAILIPFTALASPVGKFTNVEGRVDITRPDQAAVPANIGDEIFEKDIIRAKSRSKAEILFVDGNVMRIAQSTRVEISEFISNDEQKSTVLKLFRGKVQNKVKKFIGSLFGRSKERFEVHTPTSVCGVRGTDFFTFYQNGLSGSVFKEGTGYGYSLNRPDQIKEIPTGQAMIVTNPDQPPIVRPATQAELIQHENDTAPTEKSGDEEENEGAEEEVDTVKEGEAQDDGDEEAEAEEQEEGQQEDEGIEQGEGDSNESGDIQEEGEGDIDDEGVVEEAKEGESDSREEMADLDTPADTENGEMGEEPTENEGGAPQMADRGEDSEPGDYGAGDQEEGQYGSDDSGPGYEDPMEGDMGGSEPGESQSGDIGGGENDPGEYQKMEPGTGENKSGDLAMGDSMIDGESMNSGAMKVDESIEGDLTMGGESTRGKIKIEDSINNNESTFQDPIIGDDFAVNETVITGDDNFFDTMIAGDFAYSETLIIDDPTVDDTGTIIDPTLNTAIIDNTIMDNSMSESVYIPLEIDEEEPFIITSLTIGGDLNPGPVTIIDGDHTDTFYNYYALDMSGTFTWEPPFMHMSRGIEGRVMPGTGPLSEAFYRGFVGADWNSVYPYGERKVRGVSSMFYVASDGSAGIFDGEVYGEYNDAGTWSAIGYMMPTELTPSGGVPFNLPEIEPRELTLNVAGGFFVSDTVPDGTISVEWSHGFMASISGQNWGMWRNEFEGTYTDNVSDMWFIEGKDYSITPADAIHRYYFAHGWRGAYGELDGDVEGGWVDISKVVTGVFEGGVHGGYNPDDATKRYHAISGGVWMETNKFLSMTETLEGREKLQSLYIPCIEVGRTNLYGSSSVMSVDMYDVIFFSNSTGEKPRIWATNGVNGSYYATPEMDHTVNLSGAEGLSADFKVKKWDSGVWSANINGGGYYTGSGQMNGSNTIMKGGGTGTYSGGTFSGTAAGGVRIAPNP